MGSEHHQSHDEPVPRRHHTARCQARENNRDRRRREDDHVTHMDLLFVWGLVFLVATVRPSMMTSAIKVKSKSVKHRTAPLMSLVDGMRSAGFAGREVHVDGEASLASAKCVAAVAQHRIRLMTCTRGAHQAVSEREMD